MAKKTLNLTQQIETTLAYAYYAFSNKSGWMEWFSYKAYGYAKKNGMLRLHSETEGEFAFHFTAAQPNELIAFIFIDLDTMQASQVEVLFEEENGVVTISLKHSEIPESSYEQFKLMWEKGLENLKSMLEAGKDLRMFNRPFLGVTVEAWVTPEIAKEQGLQVEFGILLNSTLTGLGAEAAGLEKGDLISSLAGLDLKNDKVFMDLIKQSKAGDVVDISYYRDGDKYDAKIELSAYPVSEAPASVDDYAEKIEKFHNITIKKLGEIFEDYNEAQADFRQGSGEKSAKEILGHLVAYEADVQIWVSTLVGGCEEYPCHSSQAIRVKALLSLYPAVDELIGELKRRQKESTALLQALPSEFVNRKGSFSRLASGMNIDFSRYYKDHLAQIADTLEKAENVRAS